MKPSQGKVRIANCCFEILASEVTFGFTVEKVVGFSEVLCADKDSLRYDARQKLVPMHFAVAINIHRVKKVSHLLSILKVRRKELFDVFKCNKTIIVSIDLEEDLSESFRFFLIDFTAISNNILHALSK